MFEKKSVLIGYGGHARVVADSFLKLDNSLKFYTALNKAQFNPFKLKFLGNELDKDFKGWDLGFNFILGVGDNKLRFKIGSQILSMKEKLENVIDTSSMISTRISIGKGIFISKGVMVNSFSSIGDFTILNTGSIIEHDCIIGRGVHIGPSSIITGGVVIGQRTFVGANSVIKQGIKIGDDVLIGAGSVVLNDVKTGSIIAGNPAKLIK